MAILQEESSQTETEDIAPNLNFYVISIFGLPHRLCLKIRSDSMIKPQCNICCSRLEKLSARGSGLGPVLFIIGLYVYIRFSYFR
jgi:hypothetical protein